MAYKFQLGAFTASGSIKAEEGFDANEQNVTNVGALEADAIQPDGSTLALKGGSGNTDQMILDGSIVEAKTALRMSGSQLLQFAGTDESIGMASDFSSLDIKSVADIKLSGSTVQVENHNGVDAGLQLGATLVTATGAELNILDGVTANTSELNILDGVTANTSELNILDGVTADAGELNILDGATVTTAELNVLDGFAEAVYDASNDSIVFHDSDGAIKSDRHNDFVNTLVGNGIERSGNNLQVKRANDGALTFIGAGSDELSVQLSGSSLSKNANGLSLSDTIPGARTFSDNVVIQGNLSVEGTTVTVDSTTIAITGSIQFEGATGDGFETTLGVIDPTADRSIDLPNAGGNVAVFSDSSFQTVAVRTTVTELELLDGDSSVGSSITIEDTDGIIVNDNGTTKLVPASDIKDYAAAGVQLASNSRVDGDTLGEGMNYFADLSAATTVTLPASSGLEAGDFIYVKARNLTSSGRIVINRAGSQTIDGETSITLESPYAAVTLVYVATDDFRIV